MFRLFCRYRLRVLMLGSVFFGMAVVAAPVARATTITVVNNDGPGEGFNDPTPVTPVGGNTGTTLGDQRLIAFQHAADIWAGLIVSPVTIRVGAQFNPLPCTSTSAALGFAGPASSAVNFTGAPVADTIYTIALANALHGSDLNSGVDDITAQFNSSIGTTCAFPNVWYYGLDGNAASSQTDFVAVVLHELSHGLGFLTFVDLATGAKALGFNDAFMLNLEDHGASPSDYPSMTNAQRVAASMNTGNLHWVGANVQTASGVLTAGTVGTHVRMFAPNPQQPGSSVSHWDTALFPDELMEPSYIGPPQDVGLAFELFADLGWNVVGGPLIPTVTIAATDNTATEEGTTTGMFTVTRTGSTASALTVNYTVSGTATAGSDYVALPGSVVILTGQSTAQIVVTPIDDAVVNEGSETVIATLTVNVAYIVGTPNSATVTITDNDIVAPDTIIDSGPAADTGAATNNTTAVFNFTSTDPSATFACSLDNGAFSACTSPKTYTKLKPGAHNFRVQATAGGVTDPTPASFDWTIDKTAPNTTITSAPALLTNNPVATFTFTSTEVGGGFQCSLDASPFADCTSPFVSGPLADGKHNFQVKAVDAAGNLDKSAAKAKAWTVDTTPPNTTITKMPTNPTTSTSAAFKFTSTEKKSTFQCNLDGAGFAACTSAPTFPGLSIGPHHIEVRAIDAAGNIDPTPATFDWTIN